MNYHDGTKLIVKGNKNRVMFVPTNPTDILYLFCFQETYFAEAMQSTQKPRGRLLSLPCRPFLMSESSF